MTQDKVIETLKDAGFIFSFDDAYLLTSLSGLEVADIVKIAELIQGKAQPTPSQSVEREMFELAYQNELACRYPLYKNDDGNYVVDEVQDAWLIWQARAQLSKAQHTSQEVVDAVLAEREACANSVERLISGDGICAENDIWIHDCSQAIRERSNGTELTDAR